MTGEKMDDAKRHGGEPISVEQTGKRPCVDFKTRTFSKECVVVSEDGTQIAVATMSITTLHSFQKNHTEMLLSKIARTCRMLYLEAGTALKAEP